MADPTSATCRVCGALFTYTKKTRPRTICSDACMLAQMAANCRARYTPRAPAKTCKNCGRGFIATGPGYWRTCSPACALELQRTTSRRKTYLRRTKVVGDYSLSGVAARSLGRCHLCRRKVDMSLPGMDPCGPTIDHLVPLSEGGADELTNVALAHRQCNVRRGVRGEVQLVLI